MTNTRFWDRVAAKYAASPISDTGVYEEKLRRTRAHFSADSAVLEMGCGTGSTALLHAPHVAHIRATDGSEEMLAIARDKAETARVVNVEFEKASIDDLTVEPGTYDVVMAMSLLHLLPDCRVAIDKAWTALKPGGVFVTSTFIGGEDLMWVMWPVLKAGHAIGRLPFVAFLNQARLRDRQTEAGFVIEDEWKPGKRKAVFMIARKPA